jgi:hypothetical protein
MKSELCTAVDLHHVYNSLQIGTYVILDVVELLTIRSDTITQVNLAQHASSPSMKRRHRLQLLLPGSFAD